MTAALTVLGFLELPEDEVPPELIWHHEDRLDEWFEAVKERRKNPDSGPPMEEVPTTSNELAEQYK